MTPNRARILELLEMDSWANEVGIPPFTASTLQYILDSDGVTQSVQQIHRTLKDLEQHGLIEHSTRLDRDTGNPLPQKLKKYALTGRMQHWANEAEINELKYKLKQHHEGSAIFGAFQKKLSPNELRQIEQRLKFFEQNK